MKRSQSDAEESAEDKRPFEKILKLLDDIDSFASLSLAENPCGENGITRLTAEIRREIGKMKEPLYTTAQVIEPSALFEDGKIPSDLQPDATGGFSHVTYRLYLGQKVAVKINNGNNRKEDFQNEIKTLHDISHDNIVSFRGWGETESHQYLVMEHLDKNLLDYVWQHKNHETDGLSSRMTWEITNQLVQAMVYLHSRGIVHADLKPDNILIDADPIIPKPKICDFGRAFRGNENEERKGKGHVRFQPPSRDQTTAEERNDFRADVYAFGLVVLFMKTGELPYPNCRTQELQDRRGVDLPSQISKDQGGHILRKVRLPDSEFFHKLITECCNEVVAERPLFSKIQEEYFKKRDQNPFDVKHYGDFFECGFLQNTYIHVADSIAGKDQDSLSRPVGYKIDDLICEVETGQTTKRQKPDDERLRAAYVSHYRAFIADIKAQNVNEHVAVALKTLSLGREKGSNRQRISLR